MDRRHHSEDAFSLNESDHEPPDMTMNVISLVIHSIALMVQIIIGITALSKISRVKGINKGLTALFIFNLFCGCSYTISTFIDIANASPTIEFIQWVCLGYFFQSLLWTLVFRLHTTFKQSTYRMSRRTMLIFIMIMFPGTIGWLIWPALLVYTDTNQWIVLSVVGVLDILYFIGCVLAVIVFVGNISKLMKIGVTTPASPRNLSEKDIKLSIQQQRLSDLSAKYIMLFAMAIASTILLNIVAAFVFALRSAVWSIDLAVNILMLYLQFITAKVHYQKWCGFCDRKCREFMSKRTKTEIYRHSIVMHGVMQNSEELDVMQRLNDDRTEQEDSNNPYLKVHQRPSDKSTDDEKAHTPESNGQDVPASNGHDDL